MRVYTTVQQNEAGMCYGTEAYNNKGKKLMVFDTTAIVNTCGYIESCHHSSRKYYVAMGMVPGSIDLGDTSKL